MASIRPHRKHTGILLTVILIMTIASCRNRNTTQNINETDTVEQVKDELFPELPELSEPISVDLAYRSNTTITGAIEGWQERSKNLDAVMIMNADTTVLYQSRVMIVDHDSPYLISESPVSMYNRDGNILFVPGRSKSCPYSYDTFAQDSLIVDEEGTAGYFDFKLKNISQEQWRDILKEIAPLRIRKDYPIKPVLYYDKGDEYKYAILFSAKLRGKVVVTCGFDYNSISDTEEGRYFKKALLTYAYLAVDSSYEIPQEFGCNHTEWLDIYEFKH